MALNHDKIVRLLFQNRAVLLAYINAIVQDDHMAEDIFQDVSILAINKCSEIHDETHLNKWIRKAARDKSIDELRRLRRQPLQLSENVVVKLEGEWDAYGTSKTSSMVDALRLCLKKLSPYAAQLVRLRYVDGLTGNALATRVQRKTATVYVALSRVHRTLGQCVKKHAQPVVNQNRSS